MDTPVMLNKDFLRLLDLVRDSDKCKQGSSTSAIYCKKNVLHVTNGKVALRCVLKNENLPKYKFEDGFYKIEGDHLVKDANIGGEFPSFGVVLNRTFVKKFKVDYSSFNAFLDFIFTLNSQKIFVDFLRFEKQLKQLFYKGRDFVVYFIDERSVVLIKCNYVVQSIVSDLYTPIVLLIMPMDFTGQKRVKNVSYNPVKRKSLVDKKKVKKQKKRRVTK